MSIGAKCEIVSRERLTKIKHRAMFSSEKTEYNVVGMHVYSRRELRRRRTGLGDPLGMMNFANIQSSGKP